MTVAALRGEILAAVRAAAPTTSVRWPTDAALWAMLCAHDRADDVAGAARYARDLEVVLREMAARS